LPYPDRAVDELSGNIYGRMLLKVLFKNIEG
jgi:hypothetical protein